MNPDEHKDMKLLLKKFHELEGLLIKNRDMVPASFSEIANDHSKDMKALRETVEGYVKQLNIRLNDHSKKITDLHDWRIGFEAGINGASKATKVIWSVLGVFLIAASFGLFNMYVAFQQLPLTIDKAINDALEAIE